MPGPSEIARRAIDFDAQNAASLMRNDAPGFRGRNRFSDENRSTIAALLYVPLPPQQPIHPLALWMDDAAITPHPLQNCAPRNLKVIS